MTYQDEDKGEAIESKTISVTVEDKPVIEEETKPEEKMHKMNRKLKIRQVIKSKINLLLKRKPRKYRHLLFQDWVYGQA